MSLDALFSEGLACGNVQSWRGYWYGLFEKTSCTRNGLERRYAVVLVDPERWVAPVPVRERDGFTVYIRKDIMMHVYGGKS